MTYKMLNKLSCIIQPGYLFLRFIKSALFSMQIYYEARIAPFIAVHVWWLYWSFYKILKRRNICFVVNIGEATGHIIIELDSFFRKIKLNKINVSRRYVWVRRNSPHSRFCVHMYRHKFWFASSNTFIYYLLLPIIMRYKDITLDSGYGGYKYQLPDDLQYNRTKYGQSFWYLYKQSKPDRDKDFLAYSKLHFESRGYFPLSESNYIDADKKLLNLLGNKTDKLALIHIKDKKVNGTIEPTDPATYGQALQHLSDSGYNLVFVGREKIPEEFLKYKIINYANSDIATFERDIQLFGLAELAITGGSGISWLADCLGKSYLYLNSWFLNYTFQAHSQKCIIIPSLVQKPSGEFLSFLGQMDLYASLALSSEGPEVFPEGHYKGRNASADEVLAGLKELIALEENFIAENQLQKQFRKLDSEAMSWISSRVSGYFLDKHIKLLG